MSHSNYAKKNKKQNNSKVHYRQYLYSETEPGDDIYYDVAQRFETDLSDNRYAMKRNFRQFAQKIRNEQY